MAFKQGKPVEVLRRSQEPYSSWFPGNIVAAADDNYCIVRYKSVVDHKGEKVMEKVDREGIRPQPPHRKGKKWMVGEVVEVFDNWCWKVGKIAEVLRNNSILVSLYGSVQLKEFHQSDLRIRMVWRNNKWSLIGKIAQKKELAKSFVGTKSKVLSGLVSRNPIHRTGKYSGFKETDLQKVLKEGQADANICSPRTMMNRGSTPRFERSSNHLSPLFEQVDDSCSQSINSDKRFLSEQTDKRFSKQSHTMDARLAETASGWLCTDSKPLRMEVDSNQCSVASCSSHNAGNSPCHNYHRSSEHVFDNSSDAESSFPTSPSHFSRKLEDDIHELEFHAYRSTLQALYASGPLSWEQESLLTNLRISLHISDEEHLLQLRHLLSTPVM